MRRKVAGVLAKGSYVDGGAYDDVSAVASCYGGTGLLEGTSFFMGKWKALNMIFWRSTVHLSKFSLDEMIR